MVDDWNLRVAVQDEVAVHRMDVEILRDGALGRGETLGDHGAAVDAAGSGRVPEGARVCEEIRVDVGQVCEFEDGFHRGVGGAGRGRRDEGCCACWWHVGGGGDRKEAVCSAANGLPG